MASSFSAGIYSRFGRKCIRGLLNTVIRQNYSSSTSTIPTYETLNVQVPKPFVYHVELNRPKSLNSMTLQLWKELGECFNELSLNPECRVAILTGSGKFFTAGIDLKDVLVIGQEMAEFDDIARKSKCIRRWIKICQEGISSLEKCSKPVISVVHNGCLGGGMSLIAAADIRYCSEDAWFTVKEVDIGMAADVGALQRLPRIIGNQSLIRELCYTGRKVDSKEALACGLVSKVFQDKDRAVEGALKLAEEIAGKSPVAVQNTKKNIVYSLDHTVQEGLDQIALINESCLQSEDFINASMAQATKGDKPTFENL